MVDTETGVVRVTRIVAVQDCGLVVNKLTCESQVAGGVIMGLNYALFEERIMDRHTGRQVNADMEFYKLGGIEDMPKIVVHLMDMPERGRHRRRRAADHLDARGHRQCHFQCHRRPRTADAVHPRTRPGRARRQGR